MNRATIRRYSRERVIARTVRLSIALMVTVSVLAGCAAAGIDEDNGGPSQDDGAPEVSVYNYSYAPLKNVSINDVSVGDFRSYSSSNDFELESIQVSIPESDSYTLTAEVDSSLGDVSSFSYELNGTLLEQGTVRIGLPDTYIALHTVSVGLTLLDDPEIRISYGSFVTSASADEDRFLGVFNRLETSGEMEATWTNNSLELDYPEVFTIWGGYVMRFST